MSEIGFYHLLRSPLESALPKLLQKVLDSGARAVVMAGSPERVESLTTLLWTFNPNSFLPHGSARDGKPEQQPIWLTERDENPNGAQALFLIHGALTARADPACAVVCRLFDGADSTAVAAARGAWSTDKATGLLLTYWRQTERGWVNEASANDGDNDAAARAQP